VNPFKELEDEERDAQAAAAKKVSQWAHTSA
jgi:hypothetical protein